MPTITEFKNIVENNKGYLFLFGIAIIGVIGFFITVIESDKSKQKNLEFLNKISFYKK